MSTKLLWRYDTNTTSHRGSHYVIGVIPLDVGVIWGSPPHSYSVVPNFPCALYIWNRCYIVPSFPSWERACGPNTLCGLSQRTIWVMETFSPWPELRAQAICSCHSLYFSFHITCSMSSLPAGLQAPLKAVTKSLLFITVSSLTSAVLATQQDP